jgi:amidase
MFTVAHGNDGGGSIRIPASCCGLVGLKVSRGRVPSLVKAWEGGVVEFLRAFLKVVNSGLADYEADWDRVEPHIRANRAIAEAVDSLTYVGAVHDLQRLSRPILARWGDEFDILLTPTMTIEPPRAGEVLAAVHAGAETGAPAMQVFQMAALTSAWNMTGQPAISLPTHQAADGVPIGVQLVAGPWEEATLLRLAAQLEAALPWADRRPPL